jgi:membrane protein DedA with SNARE-associated domain
MGFTEFFSGLVTGVDPWVAYLLVFLLLLSNAPEDPILLLSGYLAAIGPMQLVPLFATVFLGIVLGDLLVYLLGYWGSPLVRKWLTPRRFARVQKLISRHGDHAALFARFSLGARFWFQLAAGASRMPARNFVFYDAIGAVVWGPLVTSIGFLASGNIDKLIRLLDRVDFIITAVVIALAALYIFRVERKERREHPERRRHRPHAH